MTVHVRENQTLNRRISAVLLSTALALLALILALLCSCSAPANTSNATDDNANNAATTEPATPSADEEVVTTAMVAGVQGDSVLFVDQETETPYYPTSTTAEVLDIDGNVIALTDLVPGNVVKVTGNNIMLESYPGQYPGITTIEVTEVGTPADADKYAELVQEVMPEPGNSVPGGAVEYADDLGVVSVLLAPYAYQWQTNDGDDVSDVTGTFFDEDGVIDVGVGDARIAEATEATLSFEDDPQDVTVERMPLKDTSDDTFAVNSGTQGEGVGIQAQDGGTYNFTMDPGFAYVIKATFDNGTVDYAFVAVQR